MNNDPVQLARIFGEIRIQKIADQYASILETQDRQEYLKKNPQANPP